MPFQTCCCRGHLPGCFNAPYFLRTRGQFSTRAVQDSESCVSRAVPNWVMLAHYYWNLLIYLCNIIREIVFYALYYIIITPLPSYLLPYLLHVKAGPRLPTSGDSSCFGSYPKLSKFFRSEALHRSLSVDPAGSFHEILFKQRRALSLYWLVPRCFLQTYIEEPVFSCTKKHRQQQHRIPFDAVAMKATASFIREKITQNSWKMLWHFQLQIKHIIWQTYFTRMPFQTCSCRGHLPGCFNAPYFLRTRGQFSTRAVQDSESCASRVVPNWVKVIFFLCEELCWRTIIGTYW